MPPFKGKFLRSLPTTAVDLHLRRNLGYDRDDEPVGIGKKPDVTLVLCKGQSPFRSLGPSVGGYISGGTALGGMFSNPRR